MTLENFTKIIHYLREQDKLVKGLWNLRIDAEYFVTDYEKTIRILMVEIYGEEGADLIEWFCYENNFGEDLSAENPKAWDAEKNPVCYDINSLHTYLENMEKKTVVTTEEVELTDELIEQIVKEKKWGDVKSLKEARDMGAKWNVVRNSVVFDTEMF
jgi:hypothetical protein